MAKRDYFEIINDRFTKNTSITPQALQLALRETAATDLKFTRADDIWGAISQEDFVLKRKGGEFSRAFVMRHLDSTREKLRTLMSSFVDKKKGESKLRDLKVAYNQLMERNVGSTVDAMKTLSPMQKKAINLPLDYDLTYKTYCKAIGKDEKIKGSLMPSEFVVADLIDGFKKKAKEAIANYNKAVREENKKVDFLLSINPNTDLTKRPEAKESIADTIALFATALTLQEINKDGDKVTEILKSMTPLMAFSITEKEEDVSCRIVKNIAIDLADQRVQELNNALADSEKYFTSEENRTKDVRYLIHDYVLAEEINKKITKVDELYASYRIGEGTRPFIYLTDRGEKRISVENNEVFRTVGKAKDAIMGKDQEELDFPRAMAGLKFFQDKIFKDQNRSDTNPDTFPEIAEMLLTFSLIVDNVVPDEETKNIYAQVLGIPLKHCYEALALPEVREEFAKDLERKKKDELRADGTSQAKIDAVKVKTPSVKDMYNIVETMAFENLRYSGIVDGKEFKQESFDEAQNKTIKAGKYGLFNRTTIESSKKSNAKMSKNVYEGMLWLAHSLFPEKGTAMSTKEEGRYNALGRVALVLSKIQFWHGGYEQSLAEIDGYTTPEIVTAEDSKLLSEVYAMLHENEAHKKSETVYDDGEKVTFDKTDDKETIDNLTNKIYVDGEYLSVDEALSGAYEKTFKE